MKPLLVLNIVALSKNLLGKNTPFINTLIKRGTLRIIDHVTPAVTCSVQSSYLTGLVVREHGIVGNGWYFKDLSEVMFWKQSNHLVKGEMVWDAGRRRDPAFSCAQLFWWYNMYNSADWSVTPRPLYPCDGRKIPDIYCSSEKLRSELTKKLGVFPLFNFWGPNANIKSSRWIADCAIHIHQEKKPTLNLVYIPHLDYALQKYGPDSGQAEKSLREVDKLVKHLCKNICQDGVDLMILSEYSISKTDSVVFPNRELRKLDLLRLKPELDYEMLDAGASRAFAVCDHQIAHLYLNDSSCLQKIVSHFEKIPGIQKVLYGDKRSEFSLDHERAGDIILLSESSSWFSYYFWEDDSKAPDYARTVDIHRKPGYDPVELFIDPNIKFPKLKIIWKLLKKKLGFRTVLDVISLDAHLVKGSHGVKPPEGSEPICITLSKDEDKVISPYEIKQEILGKIFKSLE